VFSTKERQKLIKQEEQSKLWSYMAGVARNHDFLVLANGGIEDHVHLLIQLPPAIALSEAISTLKSNSSRWMGERGINFAWQEGYGAFSVSASNLAAVEKYIHNQAIHHKKITFEQEFISLLKKHGIDFDPKYVFG
jgi:REP element-mobilizing transposase RayT